MLNNKNIVNNRIFLFAKNTCLKYKNVITSFVMTGALFIIMLILFSPTEKADDYEMKLLLYGGTTGEYSPYMMYCDVVLGYVMSFLLKIFPNVPWYWVLNYIFMFLAIFTMLTVINGKTKKSKILYFLECVVLLFVGYEFLVRITFTKVAGITICAGYLLFLDVIENRKKNIFEIIWAFVLILYGISVRDQVFKLITFLFFSAFLISFIKMIIDKCKLVDIFKKTVYFFIVVMVLYIVSIMLAKLNVKLVFGNDDWKKCRENQLKVSSLYDYGIPDYDTFREEYNELGISRNDYKMYFEQLNIVDSNKLTIDVMEKIKQFKVKSSSTKTPKRFLKNMVSWMLDEPVFYAFILINIALILLKSKLSNIILFTNVSMSIITYWIFSNIGRINHHTGMMIFIVIIFVSLFFMEDNQEKDVKRCHRLVAVSLLTFLFAILSFSESIFKYSYEICYEDDKLQEDRYDGYREIYDLMSGDKNTIYLVRARDLYTSYSCFAPFEIVPKGYYSNIYLMHDAYRLNGLSILENYNIDNIWKKITNGNIYLFVSKGDSETLDIVERYIKENYNSAVNKTLIKNVGGNKIYRFYDEKLASEICDDNISNDDIELEYDFVRNKKKLTITGQVYEKNTNLFNQKIYVKLINRKTKEERIYIARQYKNKDKEYNFSDFKLNIKIGKKELKKYDVYVVLENENGKHFLNIDIKE